MLGINRLKDLCKQYESVKILNELAEKNTVYEAEVYKSDSNQKCFYDFKVSKKDDTFSIELKKVDDTFQKIFSFNECFIEEAILSKSHLNFINGALKGLAIILEKKEK